MDKSMQIFIKNTIKGAIIGSGFTITQVVNKINEKRAKDNHTSLQSLSNKLGSGSIRFDEVLEIAEIIGYKLEWVKKS